jgi:CheY-like chemotaxis protein
VKARALTHEKEAAQAAGCDVFIAKPVDLKELADLISMIMGETPRALRSTNPRS